jgi:hypothetical protein
MAATTAVVAGTAGAVRHHQEEKYANQDAERQAAQEQAAVAEAPPPGDPLAEVQRLAELHTAGVLTDEEFAAAKAKALGI